MATRGCVQSARAFPRALGSSTDRVSCTVYSVAFTSRLLTFRTLSQSHTGARSMASSSQISVTGQEARNESYGEAVMALNSLQSNAETIQKSLKYRNEARKHNVPNMVNYLHRVGLTLDDVNKLSVIHVTGTKGKGSTCAFAESILRQYGYKTGIFSSPHLIEARERIRINGRPIDRDLFSTSFWDVYDKLQATKDNTEGSMPHYFSFLTVMAFHVFVRECVDVALLEVGIGGQFDSTNVVSSPIVCGLSSLDLDHTNLLGHTLQDIAWHKAGIFKKGAPAITVPQPDSAMQVLLSRAQETQCPLYIAAPLRLEELSSDESVQLGIAGHKQVYNAALALQLCRVWLSAHGRGDQGNGENHTSVTAVKDIPVQHSTYLSQQMITGLRDCHWPGRTQTIYARGVTYYLDGAHTADSIQQCVQWFQDSADKERRQLRGKVCRSLIFNVTGERPVSTLLEKLKECGFDRAAFCPNVVSTTASENIPDQINHTVNQDTVLKRSRCNRQAWDKLFTKYPANTAITPMLKTSSSSASVNSVSTHAQSDSDSQSHITLKQVNGYGAMDCGSDSISRECVSANFPCIASALKWGTQILGLNSAVPSTSTAEADNTIRTLEAGNDHHHVQVLVTGSLHLVGGVLELIAPDMNE